MKTEPNALPDASQQRQDTLSRWQALVDEGITLNKLQQFHARHKYLIMTRGQIVYQQLGNLLAGAGNENITTVAERYIGLLLEALVTPPTNGAWANVLLHMMGYFKNDLGETKKRELLADIDAFRHGNLSLSIPLDKIRKYATQYHCEYIRRQVILDDIRLIQ